MSKIMIEMDEKEYKEYLFYKEKQLDLTENIICFLNERITYLEKEIERKTEYYLGQGFSYGSFEETFEQYTWVKNAYIVILNKIKNLRGYE